jgi:transcriptional regulator GlxA family with amidase domain
MDIDFSPPIPVVWSALGHPTKRGWLDFRKSPAHRTASRIGAFLRTFQQLTGLTPHQYVRRMRLREAAVRLSTQQTKVLDIALDCGFGDVSNFNRAFRNEFGENPRQLNQKRH